MAIIGIDPGINYTGWAIVKKDDKLKVSLVDCGLISTNSKLDLPKRLAHLCKEIDNVLSLNTIEEASIEEVFINKNFKSSMTLCYARGIVLMKLGEKNISIREYSANYIKKAVTGYGHASKTQIISTIKMILPSVEIKRHDVADAISVAVCHAYFT